MDSKKTLNSLWDGFSKRDRFDRLRLMSQLEILDQADIDLLTSGQIAFDLADKFIENALGFFQMPFGVAPHFVINSKEYAVPVAVEETSIVAALSKTAKWIKASGGHISTAAVGQLSTGQVQIPRLRDEGGFDQVFESHKEQWLSELNSTVLSSIVARGGGIEKITLRKLDRPDGGCMAVMHLSIDVREAMGANIINQACEALRLLVEATTQEKVGLCILSNLSDEKLTQAQVVFDTADAELAERIAEASLFAEIDPYRAATHNKGVMNGMDAVLLATGNDWRAVEAGVHAYAARSGQYRSITRWRNEGSVLTGSMEAPIMLGTVGGVTRLHPMAQLALKILKEPTAQELSGIVAAVGLVQNLGALRALTTVGIIEGHMKLHIKNLILAAGAQEHEASVLESELKAILKNTRRASLHHAEQALKKLRSQASAKTKTDS